MSQKLSKFFIETSYPKLVALNFVILSGLMIGVLRVLDKLPSLVEQKAISTVIFVFILGISYVAANGIKNASRNNRY